MNLFESETLELKEIYTSELKKEIVAFANTNGGTTSAPASEVFTFYQHLKTGYK